MARSECVASEKGLVKVHVFILYVIDVFVCYFNDFHNDLSHVKLFYS